MESAALAEKLLNDLLKTTEGFQKLKKINDELKSQTQSDNLYVKQQQSCKCGQQLEPLKKENERIVKENNELHLLMIKVKEESEQKEITMKARFKQLENEKTDLQFLTNQKDFKIAELDKTVMEMKSKLEKAMQKAFAPQANDIIKGLKKELNQSENIIGRKQEFTISRAIDSQNIDPNRNLVDFQSQQQIWADELRRADERGLKYKQDIQEQEKIKQEMEARFKELEKALATRDQEIHRLSMMYKGGQTFDTVKSNFDKQTADEALNKLRKQNEFLNQENHRLDSEMQEIKELLGICENSDPTDKDRVNLKKLVRELKTRNDQMVKDMKTMENVIDQLKEGRYNELESGKSLSKDELTRLKEELEEKYSEIEELQRDNQKLRFEQEKVQQYQSAYQSNSKAFVEKIESITSQLNDKDEQLQQLTKTNNQIEVENQKLKEELNLYKGRCSTLQRDSDLQSTFMQRVGADGQTQQEQFNYLKERVRHLEQELERTIKDKTEALLEDKRLQQLNQRLEKELQDLKIEKLRVQGESQSTGASAQRLQAQLQGKEQQLEEISRQRDELERIVKQEKFNSMESEKKATDYYQQLLRVNENFQILQNEQKILSQELTMKQSELQKSERERMNQERELLQLRPLRSQLENFSSATQKQIEESVRTEFERNKLQSKVQELSNDLDLTKKEYNELNMKHNSLLQQYQFLQEQLRVFEKESFEIQAKIRRGFEIERENESITKAVEQFRDKERELNRQIEELRSQLRFKEQEIERIGNRTDNASYYQKQVENELNQARDDLLRLQEELENTKTEALKSEQRKNQLEIEVLDLRRSNQQLKEEKKKADGDVTLIRKDLDDEINKNKALQQTSERMRAMVEHLEKAKDDLVQRWQTSNHEKMSEGQDKALLINDLQNYKKELLMKDQEIQDLHKSIEQLDSNIDELQQELDQKTQELVQAKQNLERQTREFSNIQHHMSVTSSKEDNFQKRMQERENEIKQLRVEIQHIRGLLDEQTQVAQLKSQECSELLQDIQTLTRENKFVNTEFSKASQANEYLRKQNEELSDRERNAQQAVRALEMEKVDILSNYRNACIENDRLQETILQLSQDNRENHIKTTALEKDLYAFNHKMRDTDQREQNYIQEIHTLERHIDHLTHQLEQAHHQLRDVNEEKEAILHEMNNHRNLSYSMEMGSQEMQRSVANLERDRALVAHQLLEAQREADILKKQIQFEKQRYSDLERVVASERRNIHEKDFNAAGLYRENDQLKSENETLLLRIQSLQSHIDSLQKYGGSARNTGRDGNAGAAGGSGDDGARVKELEDQLREAQEQLREMNILQKENQQYQNMLEQQEIHIQELESQIHSERE